MSDRIDELVADAAFIASEAEARTAEWADRCYQSEARALKAEAMCERLVDIAASHAVAANLLREDETRDEYKARLLKAAREAVKWSGLEQL